MVRNVCRCVCVSGDRAGGWKIMYAPLFLLHPSFLQPVTLLLYSSTNVKNIQNPGAKLRKKEHRKKSVTSEKYIKQTTPSLQTHTFQITPNYNDGSY